MHIMKNNSTLTSTNPTLMPDFSGMFSVFNAFPFNDEKAQDEAAKPRLIRVFEYRWMPSCQIAQSKSEIQAERYAVGSLWAMKRRGFQLIATRLPRVRN